MNAELRKLLLVIGGQTLLDAVDKDLLTHKCVEKVALNDAGEVEVTFVANERHPGQFFNRRVYTYNPYLHFMEQ